MSGKRRTEGKRRRLEGRERDVVSRRNLINGAPPLPSLSVGEPLTRIREWINTFDDKRSADGGIS